MQAEGDGDDDVFDMLKKGDVVAIERISIFFFSKFPATTARYIESSPCSTRGSRSVGSKEK